MAEKKIKKENTEKRAQAKGSKKETKTTAVPDKEVRIKVRLADMYKKEIIPGLKEKLLTIASCRFLNFIKL